MALSTEQQILIEQRVANEARSTGLAYVLWFFLGGLGIHRFYLGSVAVGLAIPALLLGGLAVMAGGSPFGVVLSAAGGLILLADMFLIPGLVSGHKQKVRQEMTDAASFKSLL